MNFSANNSNIKIKSSYFKNSSDTDKAKKQGILLHWILSKIKTADDIDGKDADRKNGANGPCDSEIDQMTKCTA